MTTGFRVYKYMHCDLTLLPFPEVHVWAVWVSPGVAPPSRWVLSRSPPAPSWAAQSRPVHRWRTASASPNPRGDVRCLESKHKGFDVTKDSRSQMLQRSQRFKSHKGLKVAKVQRSQRNLDAGFCQSYHYKIHAGHIKLFKNISHALYHTFLNETNCLTTTKILS